MMWVLAPAPSSCAEVVAVLGSELGPYTEALNGLFAELGREVPTSVCGKGTIRVDKDTRVVVAFGGRAALTDFPSTVALVSCLAPGIVPPAYHRGASIVSVSMLPRSTVILSAITGIQPRLQRLAVLWISDSIRERVEEMEREAAAMGIALIHMQLGSQDDLPTALRKLVLRAPDAIWVPPDPLLVNRESFAVMRAFSRSNRIALYVPSEGLVENGAVAAITSTFHDIGRAAATSVRKLLAGDHVAPVIYPERVEVSINSTAAEECGLQIPTGILRTAKVYR